MLSVSVNTNLCPSFVPSFGLRITDLFLVLAAVGWSSGVDCLTAVPETRFNLLLVSIGILITLKAILPPPTLNWWREPQPTPKHSSTLVLCSKSRSECSFTPLGHNALTITDNNLGLYLMFIYSTCLSLEF